MASIGCGRRVDASIGCGYFFAISPHLGLVLALSTRNPAPGCRSMAPRKKDKARAAARKHKRALREIYDMCPEAGGEVKGSNDGKEIIVRSQKLISLPESIGTLDRLEALDLSKCPQLLELPDNRRAQSADGAQLVRVLEPRRTAGVPRHARRAAVTQLIQMPATA